jgi:hypothetical protein
VSFDVTPAFSESGSVDYSAITPIHMPGGIQVYKKTNSRTFTIGAKLISRTVAEATQNLVYLQTLRAWRMPYFGSRSSSRNRTQPQQSSDTDQRVTEAQRTKNAQARINAAKVELLGAPPPVLYLYAYSTSDNSGDKNGRSQSLYGVNINRVPVVLTELSIVYPEDVDYLPTFNKVANGSPIVDKNSEPFPVKMDVNITLVETHSPAEYEKFSLQKYKMGQLVNF